MGSSADPASGVSLACEQVSEAVDTPERNAAASIIAVTMALSVGYAVLRYHVAGDVPWKDLPFFILNKGLCLGAFVLLTFNFALGPAKNLGVPVSETWLGARRALGMSGFLFVLVHALMSFMLFTPAVYAKLFTPDGTLTGAGGISMLGGVLGFVFLWAYNLSFQTHLREDKAFIAYITSRRFLIWALSFGGVHLLFMGLPGWLEPRGWPGGLPPISLVAFTFFAVGYLANLLGRE
jgi:hypothetical protein